MEQRELREEAAAIESAQAWARQEFVNEQEQRGVVDKAHGKAAGAAGSNGSDGRGSAAGPSRGPMARWLARACVQGSAQ